MRMRRFTAPDCETRFATYHVHSSIVDRTFKLGTEEKDVFVRMMREYEAFCGVQVLSYCIMSNHFHILVEVPPKVKGTAVEMTDGAFLSKVEGLYSSSYYRDVEQLLARLRDAGSDAAALELKTKYTRRMYDLSAFMKGLKQRFTQWFNGRHNRRGVLWEGRFKSVLVQGGYAARVVAAYIDLNPIRAEMVDFPEDYKWCAYGEAMRPKGNTLARAGICRVLTQHQECASGKAVGKVIGKMIGTTNGKADDETFGQFLTVEWDDGGAEWYRMMLFADGEEIFVDRPEAGVVNKRVRKGFKRKQVESVLAKGGKLSFGEVLRCKVRYFSDGMVVGRRDFLDRVFGEARGLFHEKRKSGARPMRGVGWKKKESRLYSMRRLRKDVLG
jgi:putative transposase